MYGRAYDVIVVTEQRVEAAAGDHGESSRQRECRAHPLQHEPQTAGKNRPGATFSTNVNRVCDVYMYCARTVVCGTEYQ